MITARIIKDEKEIALAHRIRHEIFVDELGWVENDCRTPLANEMQEIDHFDQHSEFLGVFHGNELVSHTRITKDTAPWMLDSVFRHLLATPINKQQLFIPVT